MNNFLLFIAALLVLALSALFAAPFFVDWNDYRDVFEKQASRLVGREVNVGGEVSLKFLPAPVLRFENINVADEKGGFDTPFLSARSFTVWLSVPPLLRGAIEARDVALDQPLLNLQIGPDGAGNWRDIGRPDIAMPFMPRDLALDSLRIIDATVTLAHGSQAPYATLEHLDGELSSRSLRGPYKFAGSFQIKGEPLSLRLSTGQQDETGAIRLKAVLNNHEGRATYQVDGDLTGFEESPRFDGDFQAQFREAADDAPETVPQELDAVPQPAPVTIKAKVEAGPEKAQLTEIEATVRRANKPQTITGDLELAYAGKLAVAGSLASRWVDIDLLTAQMGGGGKAETPLRTVAGLAGHLLDAAGSAARLSLDLSLDQVVLAGDLMHGVRAEIIGGGGGLAIRRFSAELPGEAQLSLNGTLLAKDKAPAFTGAASISGKKLNRLLGWAGLDTGSTVAAQDGDFSLRGTLSASSGAFKLEEATGQLFGSHFSGALRYSAGVKRRFDLTLKSDRLDLGRLGGEWTRKLTIPALLRGGKQDRKRKATDAPGWFGGAEAHLDMDIGAVTLPGIGESTLSAGVYIAGGDVNIRKLKLHSGDGLRLEASGSLTGLKDTPTGSIAISADAETLAGVRALARLTELDSVFANDDARLRALAPAHIKATIRSKEQGGKHGLEGRAEGNLGGSDIALAGDLGGSLADWKTSAIAIAADVSNPDGRTLLRQLLPDIGTLSADVLTPGAGKFALRAKGASPAAMKTDLSLKASSLEWTAGGTASAASDTFTFDGKSRAVLPDVNLVLRLAGVSTAPGRGPQPAELAGDVKISGKVYEIGNLSGRMASESFTGSAGLDLSGPKPRINADINAGAASLPALLEPLIAWDATEPAGAVRGVSGTGSYWPDQSIDSALLSSFDGALKLKAKQLRLTGALTLAGGSVDASVKDGVLEIAKLEGRMLGGSFAGKARLEAEAAGLSFKAGGGARGLHLEQLAGGDKLARGKMAMEVEVEGQGLSPRGLAAALNGKGTLTFGKGEIHRLASSTPKKAAADLAAGKESDEKSLLAAIRRKLAGGSFAFKPFEANILIRNGVARAEKVRLQDPSGSAVVTSFLELATLNLDSEWLLVSGTPDDDKAPRITLTFAGALQDIGDIKPRIDADALQRHATIRQMERDVEQLENLEVPGAKKRKPERNPKDSPAASAAKASQPKREAAIPRTAAPVTAPRPTPKPKAPAQREPSARAPQNNNPVISRPLPPAAPPPPAQNAAPAPAPWTPPPSSPAPLPWLSQQPAPPMQPVQPPQAEAIQPPAAIPPVPPPAQRTAPLPRGEREQEPWDPFKQEGL